MVSAEGGEVLMYETAVAFQDGPEGFAGGFHERDTHCTISSGKMS